MQKDISHNKKKLLTKFLNKMSEKILVPVLGESITEATVAKWLKKKGDTVEADEAIVELETDKVNLEVPSPIDGVISEINFKDGDTVEVGASLGSINQNGAQVKEENIVTKISPKKDEDIKEEEHPKEEKNNVVNLEIKKDISIFEDEPIKKNYTKDEPLILTDEIKENKTNTRNIGSETLSPAVRKIVEEKKNRYKRN